MPQISHKKRVTLGLGIMGLGILGALPFRHDPATSHEESAVSGQALFGDGVALQVPGQAGMAEETSAVLRSADWEQMLIADEAAKRAQLESQLKLPAQLAELTPPPQLPDRYLPLFPLEGGRQPVVGRVLSSQETVRAGKPRIHTIHDGDTLSGLAQRYLGDPARADEILRLNSSVLRNPDVLPIGEKIVVSPQAPAAEERAAVPPADDLTPLPQ